MNKILHKIGSFFNESDTPDSIWLGDKNDVFTQALGKLNRFGSSQTQADKLARKMSHAVTMDLEHSLALRVGQKIIIAADDVRLRKSEVTEDSLEYLQKLDLINVVLQDNKQKDISITQKSGYFLGSYNGVAAAKIGGEDYRLYIKLSDLSHEDREGGAVNLYFNLTNIGYLNTHQNLVSFTKDKHNKDSMNVFGQSVLSLKV